jgi:hypothetical protein
VQVFDFRGLFISKPDDACDRICCQGLTLLLFSLGSFIGIAQFWCDVVGFGSQHQNLLIRGLLTIHYVSIGRLRRQTDDSC